MNTSVGRTFQDYPTASLMEITARPPLVFERGEGSWLYDHTGKRYLDFIQGWAVNSLGHCPPEVVRALNEQGARLISPSPAYYNEPSARLAKMLTDRSCFQRVFFANSGAEANEGALKLARKWGTKHRNGAYEVITMDHAFHGRTLAMMSASKKPGWDKIFEPKVPGFPTAEMNDIASVERVIGPKTVAVMLEPIQGESGVIPATDDFMRALRKLTHERGMLLIVDEVQTGIGRTGRMFGYEHSGIEPDIMTLGKGLGSGVPIAALLARESVSVFEHGDQGGTFNGNPLMAAVGCAVVEAIAKPAFMAQVVANGALLMKLLREMSARHGCGEVRGRGLLIALDLGRDIGGKIVDQARDEGLLLNSPRPNLLRFMPALNVTPAEIETMMTTLEGILARIIRG